MPSIASTFTGLVAAVLAGSQLAAAHMDIQYPPPFRSKHNPAALAAQKVDYSNTAPLSASGSDYPCKGYHQDMGKPEGAPSASFAPGGTYNFTVAGSASHGGGSCQVSLSYDGGATFTVIKSIIGNCPLSPSYDFTIPADAQPGTAIWAWTWFNQIGNREMYMNCAPVTIEGGAAKREVQPRAAAFSSRPSIFKANIGNGCTTVETTDVVFPEPGPDVQDNGGKKGQPVGSCGASSPAPAPGGGSEPAPVPSAPASPAPIEPTKTVAPVVPKPTEPAPNKPTTPGGVFITPSPAPSAPAPTGVAPTTLLTTAKPGPTAAPAPPSSGDTAAGTACSNEGAWNCIDGKSFQRCASGQWSAVIPMAAGTSCTPGVSSELTMSAIARRGRYMRLSRVRRNIAGTVA